MLNHPKIPATPDMYDIGFSGSAEDVLNAAVQLSQEYAEHWQVYAGNLSQVEKQRCHDWRQTIEQQITWLLLGAEEAFAAQRPENLQVLLFESKEKDLSLHGAERTLSAIRIIDQYQDSFDAASLMVKGLPAQKQQEILDQILVEASYESVHSGLFSSEFCHDKIPALLKAGANPNAGGGEAIVRAVRCGADQSVIESFYKAGGDFVQAFNYAKDDGFSGSVVAEIEEYCKKFTGKAPVQATAEEIHALKEEITNLKKQLKPAQKKNTPFN